MTLFARHAATPGVSTDTSAGLPRWKLIPFLRRGPVPLGRQPFRTLSGIGGAGPSVCPGGAPPSPEPHAPAVPSPTSQFSRVQHIFAQPRRTPAAPVVLLSGTSVSPGVRHRHHQQVPLPQPPVLSPALWGSSRAGASGLPSAWCLPPLHGPDPGCSLALGGGNQPPAQAGRALQAGEPLQWPSSCQPAAAPRGSQVFLQPSLFPCVVRPCPSSCQYPPALLAPLVSPGRFALLSGWEEQSGMSRGNVTAGLAPGPSSQGDLEPFAAFPI